MTLGINPDGPYGHTLELGFRGFRVGLDQLKFSSRPAVEAPALSPDKPRAR